MKYDLQVCYVLVKRGNEENGHEMHTSACGITTEAHENK